ncbi:hypothetical protein [Rubellimicrobium arenae]|uniref:hypothetical protein n=1 Tax=Rubellimicrobium arenae TaxID=2817372 RepID=UPI001B3147DA|nr:hypothetical protein [Rubellimicrobium arenae]
MTDQPPSPEHEFAEEQASLWRITLGPLIWALHFIACYAAAAVICAKLDASPPAIEAMRWSIGAGTLAALAGIGWAGRRSWTQWRDGNDDVFDDDDGSNEDRTQFLGHAALLLSIISFLGVIYTALPAFFETSCL